MSIHHVDPNRANASGHTTTILAGDVKQGRKCMALVPGSGSATGMTAELDDLLRRRLSIVCLILMCGGGAFFVRSLFSFFFPSEASEPVDEFGLAIHGVAVAVLAGCTAILYSKWPLATGCLRRLEMLAFGVLVFYFGYLQFHSFASHSLLEGVETAELPRVFNLGVMVIALRWLALIVIYGTFIPNTWKRCLMVVSVFAAVPMLLLFTVCFRCPIMGPLWPSAIFNMAVVLTLASATAIFGSHRISELQLQAFEAKKLGQYKLKRKIGSGGMGDVYLAEHVLLRRDCAIKTIRAGHTGDPQTRARFEREVQAMATLTHWNSVEIYDYGSSPDGTFFYVMEYLPGMTLAEMVDRHGPLPAGRAIHFLRQVCAALKEAHSIKLIHRDIKPSNVLVCRRGGVADVAKLLDFGLVQDISMRSTPEADRLTMQGAVLGSPPFISPEQARGNQPVDERSDIYGFGGLAYYLVTGRAPFERESALEMLAAHLHEAPTPPSAIRADVPKDLEAIILRCLAKKPADRFANIADVDRALSLCDAALDWDADQADAWWRESGDVPATKPLAEPETRSLQGVVS